MTPISKPLDYATPVPSGISRRATRAWIVVTILFILTAVLLPKFLASPPPRAATPPPPTPVAPPSAGQ